MATSDKDFEALGAVEVPDSEFEALGAIEAGQEPISQAESALAGAQQGATLGFADELQGGVESGLDAAHQLLNKLGITGPSVAQVNEQTGAPGPQSTLDLYRQARDASRQQFEAAQAANPGSFIAGGIAGGILPAMVAPQAIMNPLGTAAKTASMTQKVFQGAANAVPSAAIMGAGQSQADLTQGQVGQFGQDVVDAAQTGAAFGGGIPLVTGAASGVKNAVKDSKALRDLLDAYKVGSQKFNLSNPEFEKQARDTFKNVAGKIDDKIRETTQKLFKEKSGILHKLEREGVIADTTTPIETLASMQSTSPLLRESESKAIMGTVQDIMKRGHMKGPLELENTLQKLKALRGSTETEAGRKMVDEAISGLNQIQNDMSPQIKRLNNELFQVIDSSEALMKRGALEYNTAAQDLGNKQKLATLLQNSNKPNVASDLDDILNKGLETSKGAEVGPLSKLVPEVGELVDSTKSLTRAGELAKDVQAPLFRGSNMLTSTLNALKTGGTNISNKAGMAVAEQRQFLQKGVEHLSKLAPEQTKQLASQLATKGREGVAYAKVLNESLEKNNISKNAIMFGLMQQPDFRNMLRETMNEESENVENGN